MFIDFECPFCRAFHQDVGGDLADRSTEVQVFYVPFPLSYHAFAMPAAKATECVAEDEDRLLTWMDVLFTNQNAFGTKGWAALAAEAGLSDPARIEECASDPDEISPTADALHSSIEAVLSGSTPL
jgi:protein-disulfide isomerase